MTDLAAIAARHVRLPAAPAGDRYPSIDVCYCCGQPWPCDASILAAMLTPERLADALCMAQEAGQHLDAVADTTAGHWRGVAARTLAALASEEAGS